MPQNFSARCGIISAPENGGHGKRENDMKNEYKSTLTACFMGYIVQSIVNNFVPLLFVTFESQYGIPLSKITALITINFALQLCVDFASAFFIDKIGYRASAIIAHTFAALGLVSLAFLPGMLANPYLGIIISVVFYAIGGGLLEVVVSPMVEACPNEHKAKTMSMLHSFYCWGTVGVIAVSTLFFNIFGINNWKILSVLWAILPIVNGIVFCKVPIATLTEDGEKGMPMSSLIKNGIFWIFVVLMCCAGASEQAVSQWASAFVEKALGISKSVGDLAGPTLFSVLMGLSRVIYGKYGDKIDLDKMMIFSGVLCVAAYFITALTKSALGGLIGIAATGFAVGIMWPGTYSKAAKAINGGGTAMFALLALAGDVGCTVGPTFAGKIAGMAGDNLKIGILAAVVFPVVLTLLMCCMRKKKGIAAK